MSRVIVITSGKGGVGKTTITANLGSAIASLGYKIALVDADFGLRNLDLLLGLEQRVVYTAIDVLSGECSIAKALVKDKRQPNLMLLAAAQNRTKEAISPDDMKKLVTLSLILSLLIVLPASKWVFVTLLLQHKKRLLLRLLKWLRYVMQIGLSASWKAKI